MLKSLFSRSNRPGPTRREEPELRAPRRALTADEADDFAPPPGFDNDDAPAAPPRRQAPARKDMGGKASVPPRRAALRLSTVVGAVFGALMAAIGVNALALQKERHPAPWFKGGSAEEQGRGGEAEAQPKPITHDAAPRAGAQSAALEPDDKPELPPVRLPAPRVAPAPAAPAAARPKPPERPHDATASVDRRPKDPIGDLLKSGKTPASSAEPSAAVAAIQRTLAKLGYKVMIDGVIGPSTQRAIAKFEHDHRLPVKGQLTARLFQEINAAAKH